MRNKFKCLLLLPLLLYSWRGISATDKWKYDSFRRSCRFKCVGENFFHRPSAVSTEECLGKAIAMCGSTENIDYLKYGIDKEQANK